MVDNFTSDQLGCSVALRLLNVPDDFNRKELGIEADFSLPAGLHSQFEKIIEHRDKVRAGKGAHYSHQLDTARQAKTKRSYRGL